MPPQTTSSLPNSVFTVYKQKYLDGARSQRLYDMLAVPYTKIGEDGKNMRDLMRSSAIQVQYLSDMAPATAALSQTNDVVPQTLRDAYAQVTHTSRGAALLWPQHVDITVLDEYSEKAYERVGQNAMESIELLAMAAALGGTFVDRPAARASLDAGTATHRITDSWLRFMHGLMLTMKIQGYIRPDGNAEKWGAWMHPFLWHDLAEAGNIENVGIYSEGDIILKWQLGEIGFFKLIVNPYAKTFGGAGADNATAVATTLAEPANALATTIKTAADVSANIAAGKLWTIGTEETGSTIYPRNERVRIVSADAVDPTILTIMGEGPNGGLRFDHDAGEAVRNADSVYPVTLGGPESLVKVYAEDVGEYGEVLPPDKTGLLKQFTYIGWKYWGNYSRLGENRIARGEFSTSYEA